MNKSDKIMNMKNLFKDKLFIIDIKAENDDISSSSESYSNSIVSVTNL